MILGLYSRYHVSSVRLAQNPETDTCFLMYTYIHQLI